MPHKGKASETEMEKNTSINILNSYWCKQEKGDTLQSPKQNFLLHLFQKHSVQKNPDPSGYMAPIKGHFPGQPQKPLQWNLKSSLTSLPLQPQGAGWRTVPKTFCFLLSPMTMQDCSSDHSSPLSQRKIRILSFYWNYLRNSISCLSPYHKDPLMSNNIFALSWQLFFQWSTNLRISSMQILVLTQLLGTYLWHPYPLVKFDGLFNVLTNFI